MKCLVDLGTSTDALPQLNVKIFLNLVWKNPQLLFILIGRAAQHIQKALCLFIYL